MGKKMDAKMKKRCTGEDRYNYCFVYKKEGHVAKNCGARTAGASTRRKEVGSFNRHGGDD